MTINNYAWTASHVIEHPNNGQAYFIGSHLPDRKVVSAEDYLSSIRLIKAKTESEGYQFKYIHHRGESREIREKLSEITDTIEFDLPLELALMDVPRPDLILGHFSSALFTLSRLYKSSRIKAYLFEENKIIGSIFESKNYILSVQRAIEKDPVIEVEVV